jgi:serpin B
MKIQMILKQFVFAVAILIPLLGHTQLNTAAEASNQFGFSLFKISSKAQGNLFFSPLSIEAALAMTAAGAQEQTLKQMLTTLNLGPNSHANFKIILGQLNGNRDFQLFVANRIWAQTGAPYFPSFLKLLSDNYGATLIPLDFEKQTEPSREKINRWVEQQTNDKIKDLLKPGTITKKTDLVLTNAIYFKGSWTEAFKKELTKEEEFQIDSTRKKTIPFMNRSARLRYFENEELQYLQLPYKGHDLVMEIILPRTGIQYAAVEQKLTSKAIAEYTQQAETQEVEVSLPKFKAESEFELGSTLSEMGMPLVFDKSKANFRGMRKLKSDENIYISKVIHKAFVDVNEEGTEAAAATAVVIAMTESMAAAPKIFKANHPFIFFIRHLKSGAILFMGRYSQP